MQFTAAIDPVTRIEGHLKVDVDIDTLGGVRQVVDARASGTMFRGFERLLVGRDPRDAQHITERICGVCPVAHGMAAVLALDNAFGIASLPNARLMRNLVNGANFIDSHILHFYFLSLPDFVDGPGKPPWQPGWRVDKRFNSSDSAHLVGNFLQAVAMRRKAHEMGALFGGRIPHPPAYIAGGFTATPRPERIAAYKAYLEELIPFIRESYIPDVEMVAGAYQDYFSVGRGGGHLLAYGAFELDAEGQSKLLRPGRLAAGAQNAEPLDSLAITEQVSYSWFADSTNNLHPSQGQTEPERPKANAYSWLKAPRYLGLPHEVGPLARMSVNGDYRNGVSVMDRHRARALETLKIAEALAVWVDQLDPAGPVYSAPVLPVTAIGKGLTEAPRGALGHWLSIADGRLTRYQVITPTTWNASPRDSRGEPGPIERALIGTPIENEDEPIEVLRVIHSFDPCLDCAVHVLRPKAGACIFAIPHTHGEPEHAGGDSEHGAHSHSHAQAHAHWHS